MEELEAKAIEAIKSLAEKNEWRQNIAKQNAYAFNDTMEEEEANEELEAMRDDHDLHNDTFEELQYEAI